MEGSWRAFGLVRGLGEELSLKGRGRAGTPCSCWIKFRHQEQSISPQALPNPLPPGVTEGHSEAPGHFQVWVV